MKYYFILTGILMLFIHNISAETDIYYETEFNRGDVVTVLIQINEDLYKLELVSSTGKFVTGNIFFPVDSINFKGQAALIGLDSTLSPGNYTLLIKNGRGDIKSTGEILVRENIFKEESIPLDYNNTSLRTDSDPKIVSEAMEIHQIYKTSNSSSGTGLKSITFPVMDGIITSWYGDRREFLYSDGNISLAIHNGIDIAASFGTGIIAGCTGKVVFAGQRIITGNSVVIEYLPGVYGVFFHMDEIFVSKGELVNEAAIVGTLGSSGLATGPHLHWEIRVGGLPVDPFPLLESGLIDNSLIMSIVGSHTAE